MPRYIDAENINYRTDYNSPIYDNCGGHCCQVGYDCVASRSEIAEIPTADVEPIVHAHWIRRTWDHHSNDYYDVMEYPYSCSACREKSKESTKRCPECGARMDEKVGK